MWQRRIESDAEDRCRYGRSRRAIPHCCDDGAAVIRKSGPEIKNHCTLEGVSRQKLAAIAKLTPSNQESLQCKRRFQANPCSDSQIDPLKSRITARWRAFPGKKLQRFASLCPKSRIDAEGSPSSARIYAHPTARVPSRVDDASCLGYFAWGRARVGSAVAAKAGADAPGGGISLCFCRRGCAAPAHQAATLKDSRCSTRPTRLHANSFCRISSHRRWCRTACVSLQGAR